MLVLKNNTKSKDPRLGRVPQFDERSRQYPIRQLLPTDIPLRSYTWSLTTYLDQGTQPTCVGHAWAHELIARPKIHPEVNHDRAMDIYYAAQKLDEWPGENYDGTSVLGGAKAVKDFGYAGEYRWGFSLHDALLAIGYHGPGVAGINWYDGMFYPDSNGFIKPTGPLAGGHAIIVRGISIPKQYVLLSNSWGRNWGLNGDCKLSFADFERLLKEDGEFVTLVNRM